MFTKILVANRGEIALRVIRACREMGIASVAVYSDADARAPHVREADEAIHIGASPSAESYLVGDRIIEAARRVGAQAIHPGYGFLSEREWFARAVRDAGLVFIGPPAEAIAAMGSKTAARQLAIKANVPVVPGTTEALNDAAEGRAIAEQFGYPVLLKAAAGGGGKGMRVVREPGEMENALDTARREAKNAFGDDAVYVEKYIVGPRHVEIQVLGDQHGTMLSLNERECSVQRRHQKMIEEAPSVAVTPELRRAMGDTAVRAASAAGYFNAGTCEFLLDRDGQFYFLEMNTRLQVEHPVTELVTGIDLVQWQIRIASGEKLPFKQEDIVPRGWAIECRITSEDPANGFLPSTGRISYLHLPSGPGVRWDGGIEVGSEVGLYYDPMLAKLIVHAPTREHAVERMHRALLELTIEGVECSRDFHLRVMEDAEFRAGEIEIQWLERRLESLLAVKPPAETARTAAVIAALIAERDRQAPKRVSTASGNDTPAYQPDAWTRAGTARGVAVTLLDVTIDTIAAGGDGIGRADGMVVFVPRTAPGDVVRVQINSRKGFARGTVENILTPSVQRVDPMCYHYRVDRCGACQLQHITYDGQLEAKRGIIRDAVTRIGKRPIEAPDVEASDKQWGYRRKLTLAMRRAKGEWRIGLHPYGDPVSVFQLSDCPITDERVLTVWRQVMEAREHFPPADELRASVRLLDDGGDASIVMEGAHAWPNRLAFFEAVPSAVALWWRPVHRARTLVAERGSRRRSASASFEQINTAVGRALHSYVLDRTRSHRPAFVIDAYAGAGATAVPLANDGVRVLAIESDREAVAQCAAQLPAGSHAVAGFVEDMLAQSLPADVVLINPPRTGIHERVAAALEAVAQTPRAVIYVSCDPATLARDLARMPRYRIASIRGFDMFPQTAHVETVCELVPEQAA